MKHISEKLKDCFYQKGEKCDEIAKGHFKKNHRKCSLRTSTKGCRFKTFNSYSFNSKAGYVTAVLAIVLTELRAQEASSFCDFEK